MFDSLRFIAKIIIQNFKSYRNWWPYINDKSEIVISSILTQNTSWRNVLLSLDNINSFLGSTKLYKLAKLSVDELSYLIKHSGFSKRKAKTIIDVSKFILSRGGYWRIKCFFEKLSSKSYFMFLNKFREDLLRIKGIGQETADSILLYSFELPSFVIDGYTIRIVNRVCGTNFDKDKDYVLLKDYFERIVFDFTYKTRFSISKFVNNLKILHAGFVEIGKNFCNKSYPRCEGCYLKNRCTYS
ncbi:MAG: endonuclease III domain-containing protein [Brevinematia bacterium]